MALFEGKAEKGVFRTGAAPDPSLGRACHFQQRSARTIKSSEKLPGSEMAIESMLSLSLTGGFLFRRYFEEFNILLQN